MALKFLNDGYFAGKVGIGTANPGRNLQVKGTANTAIAITAPTTGLAQLALGDTDDDNYAQIILDNSTNKLQIQNGGGGIVSNRGITLDSSENVGIGTDSPSEKLDVNGNILISDTGNDKYFGSNVNLILNADADGNSGASARNIIFKNRNSEKMRIDYIGNVGIGTTSPNGKLTIGEPNGANKGDFDFQQIIYNGGWSQNVDGLAAIQWSDSVGSSNTIGRIGVTYTGSQGEFQIKDLYNGGYAGSGKVFAVRGDGRAYFTGNVGIGTTAPSAKLEVNSGATNVTSIFKSTDNQAWISIKDDASGTFGALIGTDSDESENFVVANSSAIKMLSLNSTGSFKLHNYNSTNKTGTPTFLLGTDASGNVVKTNTVPGSSAGPYLPLAGGTMTGDLLFDDNVVAKFGTGQDLRIQHASGGGGAGYIQNYTGDLQIQNRAADKDILFRADNGSGVVTSYLVLDGSTTHAYFSNPGNVGIGTTSPGGKLEVDGQYGDLKIGDPSVGTQITYYDTTRILMNSSDIKFYTNSLTERMTIESNGNVGIGTASPNQLLELKKTSGTVTTRLHADHESTPRTGIEFMRGLSDTWGGDAYTDWKIGSGSSSDADFAITSKDTTSGENERVTIEYNTGNVGIGTTNPGATLYVKNTVGSWPFIVETPYDRVGKFISTDSGAEIIIQDNSSTDNGNSISVSGDTMGLNTAGSNRIKILANGNVGIGTTSPDAKLVVEDDSNVVYDDSAYQKTFRIEKKNNQGNNQFANIRFNVTGYEGQTTAEASIGVVQTSNASSGNLVFGTRNNGTRSEKMRITSAGNVGIGDTTPLSKLEVAGSIKSTNYDTSHTSESGVTLGYNATEAMAYLETWTSKPLTIRTYNYQAFNISGNEAMRITSAGNVGIGTTTPTAPLHIEGGTNSEVLKIEADSNPFVRWVENGTDVGFLQFTGGTAYLSNMGNGSLQFRTNNTTKMLITSGGDVGIGTTNPLYKIHSSNSGSRNDLQFTLDSFGTGSTDGAQLGIQAGGAYIWNFENNDLYFATNNSRVLTIKPSGNVGIGTTSPDTKLDIEDSNPFVTIQGSSSSFVNAGVQFISNQASTTRGLGNFYYSAHSDVEWFSGLPYGGNDAFVINRNTSYTVPSSQSSPPGIGASAGTLLKVDSAGAIRFNNYSGTNKTGTATYLLGTDANGNVVKTTTVPSGSGGPYLPLAGGTMTGDLLVNTTGGYFQVDVSDNSVKHADNTKAKFGTSSDLQIVHDSFDSYINNFTGNLYIKNLADDKDIIFQSDNGSGGVATYFRLDGSQVETVVFKDFNFEDNVKAKFGGSADLQIYHDGGNSFIDNSTGNLTIDSGVHLLLKTATGESLANFFANGANELFYDNSKKLSTGIVSVGTATTAGGTLIDGWKTTTQANAINDTTIATTAYVNNKIALIPAGLVFQGTWNAATNTPTLTSGSGTTGNFYIVSTPGNTNLDGITDWKTGDWAVFIEQGASDQWEKIDNSSVLDGFGTGGSVAGWAGSGTSNTLTNAPITFSGNNSTFAGNVAVSGTSSTFNTGNSGTFVTNDANNYPRLTMTSASAQLGLFRAGNGGMYIGGSADGFRLYTTSFAQKLLVDQSGNATFAGSITVESTGSAPLLFSKSTYGDMDTDAFYRIKFQDQGGVYNDVGIGQTATGNLGFNITSGKDFLFNGGTSGNALTLTSGGNATFAGDVNLAAGKKLQYSANSFITPENNTSGAEISTAGTFIVKTGSTPTLGLTLDASQNATFAGKATSASTVSADAATTLVTKDYVDSSAGNPSHFRQGHKSHNLTNAFTTCLTVNLSNHTGCYVTVCCFGDWGSHSSAAYRGEFFLQNGANSYNEPGIILRQDDNTSVGTDQIVCQILDPTSTANPKNFEIQIRTTATTGTTSFTGLLTFTVQGQFNSVT